MKGQWEKGDKCGDVAGVGMWMGNTRQQQNMNVLHCALILQTDKQKFTFNIFPGQFFLQRNV